MLLTFPKSLPGLDRQQTFQKIFTSSFLAIMLILLLCLFPTLSSANQAQRKHSGVPVNDFTSILVILNQKQDQVTHSHFFELLKQRGYHLTFDEAKKNPELFEHGKLRAHHLIHMAPSVALEKGSSPINLISYMQEGGNVILLLDPSFTASHEKLMWELGLTLTASNTTFVSKEMTANKAFLPTPLSVAHFPQAVTHQLLPHILPLLETVVYAPADTISSGMLQPRLVSCLQTLKNSRMCIVGSLEALSNNYFDPNKKNTNGDKVENQKISNTELFTSLTEWTFQEKGVLRIAKVAHRPLDATRQKKTYQVNDEMEFHAEVEEWSHGVWRPFVSPTPMELSIELLEPYLRRHLNSPIQTKVRWPMRYGIYTIRLRYHQPGYTYLEHTLDVPLHQIYHNEYPRYLLVARPYAIAALSQVFAVVIFLIIYLHTKDKKSVSKKKD